jgi:membrane protease YdiL (CAAX protease family)
MEQDAVAAGGNGAMAPKRSKRGATIEIAVAYLLILSVIWTPRPLQRFLWAVAAAGVVILLWKSFDGWKATGFTTANFSRSLWIVGAALVLAAAAIATALNLHTLYLPAGGPLRFIQTYAAYAIWTALQQFLLQGFFLLRILRMTSRPLAAALVAAVLFAVAHLPNPVLTPMTLLWGFVACLLFLRYRNIYPLMLAHAVLGITVAITVPGPVDHNMRVGLGYLTYNRYAHRHLHPFRRSHQPAAPEMRISMQP